MKHFRPPHRIEGLESRIAPAFSPIFPISEIRYGDEEGFFTGGNAASGGDINGDGVDDMILVHSSSGSVDIVFGSSARLGDNHVDLSSLDGRDGFTLFSTEEEFVFIQAAGIGDFNGDGFADVAISAPYVSSDGQRYTGATYVVFGHGGDFPARLDLQTLDGISGFRVGGDGGGIQIRASLAAGDLNGDGLNDLFIGAASATPGVDYESGVAFVLFGTPSQMPPQIRVADLDGPSGFRLESGVPGGGFGYHAATGDFNSDGFDDLLIAALSATPEATEDAGAVYVVYGRATPFPSLLNVSTLHGSDGFRIEGETGSEFGNDLALGDFNADGFDDILVGAFFTANSGSIRAGSAYVIFGTDSPFPAAFQIGSLQKLQGIRIDATVPEGRLGYSVANAGDFNGDGISDIVVTATGTIFGGAGYLLFGRQDLTEGVQLSELDGVNGMRFDAGPQDLFNVNAIGQYVRSIGDINHDGVDDLAFAISSDYSVVILGGDIHTDSVRPGISDFGRTASYLDIDGDLVSIHVSRGTLRQEDFIIPYLGPDGAYLERIDLTDHPEQFVGGDLIITATPHSFFGPPLGDARVNLGEIDATGVSLRKIVIPGDLTAMRLGLDEIFGAAAVKLDVGSLGVNQSLFPDVTPGLEVRGHVGKLLVGGAVADTTINVGTRDGHGIRLVHIGGDLKNSSLQTGLAINTLKIGGSLLNSTVRSPGLTDSTTIVGARAFRRIEINGGMEHSQVLAGFDETGTPVNGDAGIGIITINGSLIGSDVIAGIYDATADGFGRNDRIISGSNESIVARIGKIVIRGSALGTSASDDFFGIAAEEIRKAIIHRVTLHHGHTPLDYLLDPVNDDARLTEVLR